MPTWDKPNTLMHVDGYESRFGARIRRVRSSRKEGHELLAARVDAVSASGPDNCVDVDEGPTDSGPRRRLRSVARMHACQQSGHEATLSRSMGRGKYTFHGRLISAYNGDIAPSPPEHIRRRKELRGMTDPTGRCFISYRRSHLDDINKIVEAMMDVGVPVWQDRRNLESQPLGHALTEALSADDTSGSLVWISDDIRESPAILELEAPSILKRARDDRDFFAELWLADGMEYRRASELFRPAGMVEDIAAGWHLERARTVEVKLPDGAIAKRISDEEALRIACRMLERRLRKIHQRLPAGDPLSMKFSAHGEAGEAFFPGTAIQLNCARHFTGRHATAQAWEERVVPAMKGVFAAVRNAAPGRPLVADGFATISACLLLGHTFREVAGIPIRWLQMPARSGWCLTETDIDSGFVADPIRRVQLGAHDLAVFVSATADVEHGVAATAGLPAWQAVLKVRPADGSARRELGCPGHAAHLARLIVRSIREARRELLTVERTHLFFAGPIGLAMLVGRQLNAVGPVQTYEHDQSTGAVGTYSPAVLLTDS